MVQLWHCRAGDLNSVSHVPHTMPVWGTAFRFWGGVIAVAVVVQFSLFRYLQFFTHNFFFLHTIYYYCVFVNYFSTALVHWYAYESCFVGSSITISLAWVSFRPWQITCLLLVGNFSSIYFYYPLLNLGLFTVHFTILISL